MRSTNTRTNRSAPRARSRKRHLALVSLAAAAIALTACGGDSSSSAAQDEAYSASYDASYGGDSAYEADVESAAMAEDGEVAEASSRVSSVVPGLPAGRDIIVTIDVSMESDDLRQAIDRIVGSATTAGGYLATSDIYYGDESETSAARRDGYATLTIRVPTQSTQTFVDALPAAGTITSSTQTTQDVTNQLVDLDVRIANARNSVETVRGLLEKAVDIGDVIALESELTSRVTELELLEAQQRGLSEQVAMSTVNVSVHTPGATPEAPQEPTIASSLRDGWDAFTSTVGGIARGLAAALPFLVTGVIVFAAAGWALRRHRKRSTANQGSAPQPPSANPPSGTPPTDPDVATIDESSLDIEQQAA